MTLIRTAAVNYLLDAGVQWAATPAVKVFAGCKPLLDKTLGMLVEGLIDIFIGLFNENKSKDLRALDTNGFCQLMLEVNAVEITPSMSELNEILLGQVGCLKRLYKFPFKSHLLSLPSVVLINKGAVFTETSETE